MEVGWISVKYIDNLQISLGQEIWYSTIEEYSYLFLPNIHYGAMCLEFSRMATFLMDITFPS